jgi:hypothetical protein
VRHIGWAELEVLARQAIELSVPRGTWIWRPAPAVGSPVSKATSRLRQAARRMRGSRRSPALLSFLCGMARRGSNPDQNPTLRGRRLEWSTSILFGIETGRSRPRPGMFGCCWSCTA